MAQLPGENWIIQQIGGSVVLYHRYTEEEIVRFDPDNPDEAARAQKTIHDSGRLNDEEKCFAHFWSGYFHAHSGTRAFGAQGVVIGDNSTQTNTFF